MVQFDALATPIFFVRFYRNEADSTTKRIPVLDLADAKDRLKEELRERFENHKGPGKPPLMADIVDEEGDQLLVARYVALNRIDIFELDTEKTAVRAVRGVGRSED